MILNEMGIVSVYDFQIEDDSIFEKEYFRE